MRQPTLNPPKRNRIMKRIISATLLAAGVLAAAPSFAITKADEIGERGVADGMTRTIHVTPSTPYINVSDYETVNLEVNGQTVTWKFDGLAPVINLKDIIPGAPSVYVYVRQGTNRFHPAG
jgi:hypothetical protein